MLCIYSRQFVEFEEVKDFSRNDINVVTKDWESYDHSLFIRFMKFSFQGIFDQESSMQIQSVESLIMIIAPLVVNAVLEWKEITGNSNKMIPVFPEFWMI
jgi:hypothetical protein